MRKSFSAARAGDASHLAAVVSLFACIGFLAPHLLQAETRAVEVTHSGYRCTGSVISSASEDYDISASGPGEGLSFNLAPPADFLSHPQEYCYDEHIIEHTLNGNPSATTIQQVGHSVAVAWHAGNGITSDPNSTGTTGPVGTIPLERWHTATTYSGTCESTLIQAGSCTGGGQSVWAQGAYARWYSGGTTVSCATASAPHAVGSAPYNHYNLTITTYPDGSTTQSCTGMNNPTGTLSKPTVYGPENADGVSSYTREYVGYYKGETSPVCTAPVYQCVVTQPDLTASVPADVYVALGQAIPMSGTALNIGTGSSTAGNAIFVTNLNGTGTAWNTISQTSMAAIIPGGTAPVSLTFPAVTFSAVGEYQYQLCVDFNTSWAGSISEGNEANNCSSPGVIHVGYPIPPAVPWVTHTCNAAGTMATVSWGASSGASAYYVRTSPKNSGSCPSGWQPVGWSDVTCVPNPDWVTDTSITYTTIPGQAYTAWVHAANPVGGYSAEVYHGFTCSAPSTLSCTVSTDAPAVGQSVRFSAAGGSPSYTWTFSEGGSQVTSTSYLDRTYATAGTYGVTLSKSGMTSDTCPLVTVGSGGACVSAPVTLTAPVNRVKSGNTGVISWNIPSVGDGVTACTITSSANPGWSQTIPISSCSVSTSGTVATHAITGQTTFTLMCGSYTSTAVVNVLPVIDEV